MTTAIAEGLGDQEAQLLAEAGDVPASSGMG